MKVRETVSRWCEDGVQERVTELGMDEWLEERLVGWRVHNERMDELLALAAKTVFKLGLAAGLVRAVDVVDAVKRAVYLDAKVEVIEGGSR